VHLWFYFWDKGFMGMVTKKLENCRTPLIALLLLVGIDVPKALAQEVAAVPSLDLKPIIRREDLLGASGLSAGTLAGVSYPIYDMKDFVQAPLSKAVDPMQPVDSDTALAGLVRPQYSVEMFSPKAIAQAKKPEVPKPTAPKPQEDDTEDLDPIDVRADRRTRPENKVTGTTFTVTRQDLTASGATTVSEALTKLAPGFFAIDSLGGLNTDQGVFLRGLGSNRFLVLIDGRPTTRPSNNRSADLGRLGVSNIERIELVTGGAGLRYGAGAVAGAINIITRIPQGPDTLQITAEGGSFGFSRQTVNFTSTNGIEALKPGYIGYELNYERRSALNNYSGTAYQRPVGLGITGLPPGFLSPDAPFVDFDNDGATQRFYQVPISYQKPFRAGYVFSDDYAAKIIYQPALDHTIRASFGFRSTRSGDQFANPNFSPNCQVVPPGYGNSPESNPLSNTNSLFFGYVDCTIQSEQAIEVRRAQGNGDQAIDALSGGIGWDWKLSETNKFSFVGSFAADYEDNPSSPGTRIASSQIINVQFNYSAELAKNNNLNAGFEYFQQRYNTTPLIGTGGNQEVVLPSNQRFFALDISKSSYAFYATDQWRFFDDAVVVDLGIRTTTDQFFGTFTTPGAGFRWNFGGPKNQEMFALKASWFQSFRAPGLADIFGYSGYNNAQLRSPNGGSVSLLRNLAIKPETGVSYDVGLDIRLSPSTLFRIVYFRTDLNNAIVTNVGVNPQPKTLGTYALAPVPGNPNIPVLPAQFQNSAKYTLIPSPPINGVDAVLVSPYTPQQLETLKFAECGDGERPFINGQTSCLSSITNYNAQSYLSTGWEFSFRWQITPQLEFSSSYSLVDARPIGDSLSNNLFDTVSGTNVPLGSGGVQGGYFYNYQSIDVPFSTGNVGLRYTDGRFRAALNGLFVGLRPRALGGNNYNEPYSRWDITFGVPLTDEVTFTGGVFNLFNDRSVLADSTLAIGGSVLQAPTTFRLGVEMAFSAKP
jgi:iron complex outermembrane recepter protein